MKQLARKEILSLYQKKKKQRMWGVWGGDEKRGAGTRGWGSSMGKGWEWGAPNRWTRKTEKGRLKKRRCYGDGQGIGGGGEKTRKARPGQQHCEYYKKGSLDKPTKTWVGECVTTYTSKGWEEKDETVNQLGGSGASRKMCPEKSSRNRRRELTSS